MIRGLFSRNTLFSIWLVLLCCCLGWIFRNAPTGYCRSIELIPAILMFISIITMSAGFGIIGFIIVIMPCLLISDPPRITEKYWSLLNPFVSAAIMPLWSSYLYLTGIAFNPGSRVLNELFLLSLAIAAFLGARVLLSERWKGERLFAIILLAGELPTLLLSYCLSSFPLARFPI